MSRHSFILDHAVICGLCRCQTVFFGCAIVFRVMVLRFSYQCLSVHLSVHKIVSEDQYSQPTLMANILVWKFSVLFNV